MSRQRSYGLTGRAPGPALRQHCHGVPGVTSADRRRVRQGGGLSRTREPRPGRAGRSGCVREWPGRRAAGPGPTRRRDSGQAKAAGVMLVIIIDDHDSFICGAHPSDVSAMRCGISPPRSGPRSGSFWQVQFEILFLATTPASVGQWIRPVRYGGDIAFAESCRHICGCSRSCVSPP